MGKSISERSLISVANLVRPLVSDSVKDWMLAGIARAFADDVVTYRELAARDDVRIWWFGSEQEYVFSRPDYYDVLPPEIDRLVGSHTCRRPFVLEVPDITLKGAQGFKITPDGDYAVFNFWKDSDKKDAARGLAYDILYGLGQGTLPDFRPHTGGGLPETDLAVPLLSKHATNYTHWAQDCLALLEGVEEYRSQTGNDPVILIPPDPPAFVPESLEVLGYAEDQYAEMTDKRLKVNRLVLPSTRRCLSDTSEDYFRMISGLEWVRDRALENIDAGGNGDYAPRVLISREDSNRRRIANREETTAALAELGFEAYVPGRMSYQEQVRLFSQADFVVGVHGAGMINSIYATDAGVLELYGDHYLPANFELAQGLGLAYGCLQCETANENNDVIVDTDEVVRAVRTMEEAI